MILAEIAVSADIREAEPWNALSILAALLLLVAAGYLAWRKVRRP